MTETEIYVRAVLAVAPLLVCLAWRTEGVLVAWKGRLALASGLLFGASALLPALAVWGAVPWLGVSCVEAAQALRSNLLSPPKDLAQGAHLAARLYLPVGGMWAVADQAKLSPLGFSGIIVLLTAVHFHYAGFALPWLTSRWLRALPGSRRDRICALGVIAGVPLVAVGITSSQLSLPAGIETVSATVLALSAFGVARGYLAWSTQVVGPSRPLFILAGAALAGGMSLALLYGWRTQFPISWVTIPGMVALHGTLNSWGFCLPGILGNFFLGGASPFKENRASNL